MDSFFVALKKAFWKSYYGKNNFTSKYSNFFNIVNLSKKNKYQTKKNLIFIIILLKTMPLIK